MRIDLKKFFVLALLMVVAAAGLANATSLKFVGPSVQAGCQCDPQTFNLQINNDAADGEVFTASIDFNDGNTFTSFVTPSVAVGGHSSEAVVVFVTPHCDALPGNYSFTVRAQGSRGTTLSASGISQIWECHYLQLRLTPEQSVCGGEEATYLVTLKNAGVFPEKGNITTDLNPALYSIVDKSFNLQPGEEKQYNVYLNIPARTPPSKLPFKITAVSEFTYRDSFASIVVADCSGLRISMPADFCVQPGEPVTSNVGFTNTGVADSFGLTLSCPPFVSLSATTISLIASETKTLSMTTNARQEDVGKTYGCQVRATSQKYGKQYTGTVNICVKQLYEAELKSNLAGDKISVCKGDAADVGFTIKNKGKAATYSLSASGVSGSLSASSVSLSENGSQSFTYSIDAKSLSVGKYVLSVKASNQFFSTQKNVDVTVENCFESELAVSQPQVSLCPGETVSTTLTIKNKGTRADSFDLSADTDLSAKLSDARVDLASGAQKQFTLQVTAPIAAASGSIHPITVRAHDRGAYSAVVNAKILSQQECHSLGLVLEPAEANIEVCTGATSTLTILNKGRFSETLDLSVSGETWAFSTPKQLTIAPGASAQAFVYYAPPFNTPVGKHVLIVKASNEFVSASTTLTVNVFTVGGLGVQKPVNQTSDYGVAIEPPTQAFMEEGVEKTLSFTITNKGLGRLHGVMVFLQNDLLEIVNASVKPIELDAGKQAIVSLQVRPLKTGGFNALTRVVSLEAFNEKMMPLVVANPSLDIQETGQEVVSFNDSNKVIRVSFEVKNNGGQTTLAPELGEAGASASFEPKTITLAANESKTLAVDIVTPIEVNASYTLRLNSDRGVYSAKTHVFSTGAPALSGLFAGTTATLVGFVIAIIAGLVVVYLMLRRKSSASAPAKPAKTEKRTVKKVKRK